MAKYLGFRNGNLDKMCANDAEKSACEAVDTAQLRTTIYVEVNDADFAKSHDVIQQCSLGDGSIVWDEIVNDETLETSQADAENGIQGHIDHIERWLNSPVTEMVDASIVSGWQAYLAELKAIDCSSKTWPKTGTHPLAGLVGDGLAEYKHTMRLP